MSRCWLALVEGPAEGADACARAWTVDGRAAGTLAAWRQRAKPVRGALRVDGRLIDPAAGPAWISLVLAPAGVRLPFDDPAVQHARRLVLSRPPAAAVSTLLRDDSHFEGAITVATSADHERWLADDPFARIFPGRLLAVDAGILGPAAAPTGPTIERYGSDNPWPWDRFGCHPVVANG
jgi:hypothetical protein